ncbi:hypothetical protein [Zhongshania aliphaticivorans]|uniref:hypothetical protein n=1 Tax=Zhongshania aliphaticivorans TaxID=1470434 RepID=UPI0012E59951|nr:hypothetical protein [Zhongshania aliphaticivorans]CAA0103621.1 Uncharacterised protein [Zhongshania aliphaticivorans]
MPFAQNKATLCWPNLVDKCTLSSEATFTRPLDRIKARVLKDRAITTDLTCQFTATLDTDRPVGVVALISHNLSVDAQWRVRIYDAADALLEDSGLVDVWLPVFSTSELAWEDSNFWSGKPTNEDRARFTPQAIYLAGKNWYVKKIVIDLVDEANTDGFIQIGRMFLSNVFQPTYNFAYGIRWGLNDPTEIDKTLDQTEYFDEQPQTREVTIAFDWISEAEAFSRFFRMRREVGVSREVLFFHQINVDIRFTQRTMLARVSQTDPVVHPDAARHTHSLTLKELI